MSTPQDPRAQSAARPPSQEEVTGHADPDKQDAASLKKQHGTDEVARMVEAGEAEGAGSEGHAAALDMWTDNELRERMTELGLDPAGKSREEMIAAVEHH